MNHKIIETGSTGNCFLFGQEEIVSEEPIFTGTLIVDMGLPFSRVKGKVDFSKITHILLTHEHGDHFNKTAIRNIHLKYKHIVFVCGEWLFEKLRITLGLPHGDGLKSSAIKVIEMETQKPHIFGDFEVWGIHIQKKEKKHWSNGTPSHDAENCGYRFRLNGHKHIHITDTSDLNGIVATNYDSATIECNHHYPTAKKVIDSLEDGEFHHLIWAVKNHLSVDKVIAWCKLNGIKSLTPVHVGKSTRVEVEKALRDAFEN